MTSGSHLLAPLAELPHPADVPVEPDAETARQWLRSELLDPVYHQRPSLLDLLGAWFSDLLDDAGRAAAAVDPLVAALTVAGALAAGIGIALLVTGRVRLVRRGHRASTDVFGDDTRSADELRASADELARQGLWSQAVLDRFRAVLRSLEERVVLDEQPGRTAAEASSEAGTRLPDCAPELARAARLFDDICYGDASGDEAADAWMRTLDQRVAATRPSDPPARTASDQLVGPR